VLDALLAAAAQEAGADLIEGFAVGEVLWSAGRAVGVRGHHRASAGSSLRARIVVGADGLHSTVARGVAARAYLAHPSLTAVYYSYWSGIRHLGASFHARPGRLILVWPTNDDLTCIYVAWPRQEFGRVRTDAENHFYSSLDLVPGLRDTVMSGRREGRLRGTGDLPNLYRTSAGPGWALAGDAGHHQDPSTGMGMSDAFLAAELLAEAIHDGLAGRRPIDEALAGYQRRRDELTADGFGLTLITARLAPLTARLEAFYRAAAEQPELSRQVFGVLSGALPAAGVYPGRHIETARNL
jgi:flavin-dependent dehydrogenase